MALQLDMILQVGIEILIEITRHRALVRRGTGLINKGFKKLGNRFFFVRRRNHFERRASSVPLVFDFFGGKPISKMLPMSTLGRCRCRWRRRTILCSNSSLSRNSLGPLKQINRSTSSKAEKTALLYFFNSLFLAVWNHKFLKRSNYLSQKQTKCNSQTKQEANSIIEIINRLVKAYRTYNQSVWWLICCF